MGILDISPVAEVSSKLIQDLQSYAGNEGVQLSPFATEALVALHVSTLFEPAKLDAELVASDRGAEVYSEIDNMMADVISDIVTTYKVHDREDLTGTITGIDVFHWLSERSGDFFIDIECPWTKD